MKHQPRHIIGSTTLVNFPEWHLNGVPAKVDTGADKSAIWASNITQQDGILSFTLFDETSPYFTGEVIKSNTYTMAHVKNSFGVSERRYKIGVPLEVDGKHINAKFTLADRSNNRFPVLIGKQTIKNKFIVDVAHDDSKLKGGTHRVLVLASARSASANTLIRGLKHHLGTQSDVAFATYEDLGFEIIDGKLNIFDINTGEDLRDFDLVYFRTYLKYAEIAGEVADYLTHYKVRFLDREVAAYHAKTKLTQYVKLALHGLPLPNTLFIHTNRFPDAYERVKKMVGVPFVLKDINAERGDNNHLIRSQQAFKRVLNQDPEIQYIAQEYIPNTYDLRVLVFDKRVALVMKRSSTGKKTHLHNTSKGATSEVLPASELDAATKAMCLRAASTLNRQIAGVDLIRNQKANKWYILEVNKSPQISSGTFTDEKIEAFSKFLQKYLEQ